MQNFISARQGDANDFEKLKITKQIEPWEDGMRTTGESGTFEWWYFDSHLSDGSTLVIVFSTKPMMAPELPVMPQVMLNLDRPDGTHIAKTITVQMNDFSASKEICDVRTGKHSFKGNLHHYDIVYDTEEISVKVKLDNIVPSWRPVAGYTFFGAADEHYFAWLPATPEGNVVAEIRIDEETETLTGIGYHDHNWGNVGMDKILHHWYWARAKVGEYTTIAAYMYARPEYGYERLPIIMLAKGEEIILDDPKYLTYTEEDEVTDEFTGKPYHKTIIYDYNDGSKHYVTTYKQEDIILRERFIDAMPKEQKALAQKAGFDGAYLRFTGKIILEKYDGDKIIETVENSALWEEMYFGKSIFGHKYE